MPFSNILSLATKHSQHRNISLKNLLPPPVKNHLLFWFYHESSSRIRENLAFLNETEMVRNRQFAYQLGNTIPNTACKNLFLQVIVHCLRYNFICKIFTITAATLTKVKSHAQQQKLFAWKSRSMKRLQSAKDNIAS